MSHMVTDVSQISKHHKKNYVESLRIIGTVLDYDALNSTIIIRSLNTLSKDFTPLKLTIPDDLLLSDPQLAYSGTVVDVYCLYHGDRTDILSIEVVDIEFEEKDNEVLKYLSDMAPMP